MFHSGLLVVVSAPSGTGKGTLLGALEKLNSNIRFSISATTRNPREGEIDGTDYFFKSVDEFKKMVEDGELIEWVEYCDNFYGTPKSYIEECLMQGFDVVLEIEVEGAINIRKRFSDSVLIFVLPPSFEELKRRIIKRGTENPYTIEKRIEKAKEEIKYIDIYDYIVLNDSVDNAVNQINSILTAEKLKYQRNNNILEELGMFVQDSRNI